jgi:hypothetical protein
VNKRKILEKKSTLENFPTNYFAISTEKQINGMSEIEREKNMNKTEQMNVGMHVSDLAIIMKKQRNKEARISFFYGRI